MEAVFGLENVFDAGKDGIQGQLLSEVTKECFMPVTLGGGVKSIEDFKTMLECGADKVAINTSALATPELIETVSRRFGAQCVVISIDVRKVGDSYEVFCGGGHDATGKDPIAWAKEVEKRGAGEISDGGQDQAKQGKDGPRPPKKTDRLIDPQAGSGIFHQNHDRQDNNILG